MAIIVSTSKQEKIFTDKDMINVGTNQNCDFVLDLDFDLLLTIQNDKINNKCTVINTFHSDRILFKGQVVQKVEVGSVCKLMLANSDEYISVKILADEPVSKTVSSIAKEEFTEEDIKGLYGKDVNAITKVKIEKQKELIEKDRVAIIKQVGFTISDLKQKLTSNRRTAVFLHILMFFSALLTSFGLSNYLMGLQVKETASYLHLPTNIKVWIIFTLIVYGICLLLKQGIYLFLQSKINANMSKTTPIAQNFMIAFSLLFIIGIYVINLIYYKNVNDFITFAFFLALFFTGIMAVLAVSCGYFKSVGNESSATLDKYEYREDFEDVLKNYRTWIDRYINSLSNTKQQYIKDKLFNLQLKSVGETIIGIITAPFLAYGVSNTLAMCFPEAAGWIRISGLRFSPVFLVLATFLIIFAFFSFVSAFFATKKIQGSQVIKQDGFSDFIEHGVSIYGIEGVKKIETEKNRALAIACAIIFIEFAMNVSYFMTEIGGDLQGMFLSLVAALVPTALLIAETLILSQTKFEINACDELLSKVDKD